MSQPSAQEGAVKPQPLAMVGHVGRAKTGPEEQQREGLLGRCPQVAVEVGGWKFLCLLDTGSQITLFSEGYNLWFGEQPLQNPAVLEWLFLRAENGLQIPFIGYALRSAHLTRRDPVQVAALSEVLRWAQGSGEGLSDGQCGLVEGVDNGGEWKVARELFQVQGGRDMVLQTPSPEEVVVDVRTTQAPAGVGIPLDLPEAKGLTPDQQQWFRMLIRWWAGVFVAHEEDFAFKRSFIPYKDLCVEESLMLWKGRLGFRQCIPSKRHKFGVKFFVLCDVVTGYVQDMVIDTGATTAIKSIERLGGLWVCGYDPPGSTSGERARPVCG
ncbi:hypothetical protein SKAU_G00063540 [Synaphobranchus kaupii]|uniref:PiggyBac transposable element-derived protein domain-containing protein n=1 Tax=Synaphobranchus kaupii TaxID=118154 RepID=A0A9Q1G6H7_SYNKA|nr:hypothetical protein SKAU_G00063540 [Synaphobranchus kaupii]